ncbi:hypothetical protein DPMN_168516 [Dreissena polymorpha]|uniref:Peptidylglycine monooxygenase n=1 Tax=Dreissena polymorpha TaxID=45954 RepID=A0A9D4F3H2_DREPO|nr:hypothetical protein DPMN_168516 [Dreissena polymorpha]
MSFGDLKTKGSDSTVDIILTYVRIPPVRTYYVCQQFEISDDLTLHVTRFEPIINSSAIHHMLLFGCEFDMETRSPHPCIGLDYRCRSWMVKWDVGMEGVIDMPDVAGVRIGKGSFKYLLLQIHWNNPQLRGDLTDQSGFRLHVTTRLRPYDVGNVQIGQNKINIPGMTSSTAVSGTCPGLCTQLMLPAPIHLTEVYLHMHGLGVKAAIDIIKDREVWTRLAEERDYDYQRPTWHHLRPAAIFEPGNSLRLTCWYDSNAGPRVRQNATYFGQGSQAEMCYAFIRYYPRVMGFDQCIQNGTINLNC